MNETPSSFDGNYARKQAHTAALDALNSSGNGGGSGVQRAAAANRHPGPLRRTNSRC